MGQLSYDDITYAMETTVVVRTPDRRIDTFGTTNFEFCLLTELMDDVNKVRVREGRIEAEKPRILNPDGIANLLFDGFGDHGAAVADWFRTNRNQFAFLKYGFNFYNRDMTESVVHDTLDVVTDRIVEELKSNGNPSKAVIQGVDDTWAISLLKFTGEMIAESWPTNEFDFKRRGLM